MLPTANPSVIFQKIDDGAVLFSPGTELYFGLNEVGAAIWELLPPRCATIDDLCAHLMVRYPDVPGDTIRVDVTELLAQLVAEGLADPAGHRGSDAAATS